MEYFKNKRYNITFEMTSVYVNKRNVRRLMRSLGVRLGARNIKEPGKTSRTDVTEKNSRDYLPFKSVIAGLYTAKDIGLSVMAN